MNEEKKSTEETAEEEELELHFSKEYRFEGELYRGIDLGGLRDIVADDMIAVNRRLSRNGNTDLNQEMTLEYACEMAARVSHMPVEFFRGLPPVDAIGLRRKITSFIYGAD